MCTSTVLRLVQQKRQSLSWLFRQLYEPQNTPGYFDDVWSNFFGHNALPKNCPVLVILESTGSILATLSWLLRDSNAKRAGFFRDGWGRALVAAVQNVTMLTGPTLQHITDAKHLAGPGRGGESLCLKRRLWKLRTIANQYFNLRCRKQKETCFCKDDIFAIDIDTSLFHFSIRHKFYSVKNLSFRQICLPMSRLVNVRCELPKIRIHQRSHILPQNKCIKEVCAILSWRCLPQHHSAFFVWSWRDRKGGGDVKSALWIA